MPERFHVEPPIWLAGAVKEIGVQSFQFGSSNPRITAYHEGTSVEGHDDKASWCSSFVHWALAQVGVPGTSDIAGQTVFLKSL